MTLEHLIARYGLAALFVGAGFEGETAVLVGGVLAHAGFFPLPAAMAAASTGSCAADQLFFFIGRHVREGRIVRWARGKPVFARALGLVERHPIGFTFAFRFIYGFRTVSPFAIGATRVPARLFVLVNIAAAIVWGCLFTALGFLFGREAGRLLERWRPGSRALLIVGAAVVVLVAAGLAARRLRRGVRTDRRAGDRDADVTSPPPAANLRASPREEPAP